jgi:DNA-binding NtrC family response regulator
VAVNAGGLSADLIESQLFGHERGAFTGAQSRHRGVFEQAEGGTLFLDEIGELPMSVQARLLRVLENWAVRPLGAERERAVDVRLVCATHRDLRSMVRAATFREDLYYRIARLVVTIAPLRDRPEDVLALARHFLRDLHGEIGVRSISQEASVRLLSHSWPGNARELRNVVAAAAALSPCTAVSAEDVDRALAQVSLDATGRAPNWASVVDACAGNLSEAARALGVPRETLRDRIRRSHRGR